MLRRSFLWKLYVSYAALVLVSAAVIGTLVLSHLRGQALRETEASLYRTARLLASMEAANPAHLRPRQAGALQFLRERGRGLRLRHGLTRTNHRRIT